jgi:uncharacterized protein involved in exopolysaccharide biosynthesis
MQTFKRNTLLFLVCPVRRRQKRIHLRDYLHILLRRKWTLITFFIIVVTTVLIGTFLMTPIYRSTATIKIDREDPQVLKFEDIYKVERADEDYYQTQYKILKSRNLAKRVIRSMKLGENPEFAGKDKLSSPENVSKQNMYEDINKKFVDSFLGSVTITPEETSRLVKVSFDSNDPKLSAQVANEIAKSYIRFNIESRFEATQQASDWLTEQLDDMKAKVEKSEESLNKYAADNRIILTEGETQIPKTQGKYRNQKAVRNISRARTKHQLGFQGGIMSRNPARGGKYMWCRVTLNTGAEKYAQRSEYYQLSRNSSLIIPR